MAGIAVPSLPTYELNATVVAAREAEDWPLVGDVPDFVGGLNAGGSNAPGVGINTGDLNPKVEDWTTEDQHENVRIPQLSQHIGGVPTVDGAESPVPVAGDSAFVLQCVQGVDINDELGFAVADAQVALDGDIAGTGVINKTGTVLESGDRAWGPISVA